MRREGSSYGHSYFLVYIQLVLRFLVETRLGIYTEHSAIIDFIFFITIK